MLSLFYEGRISCFQPVTFLDRTGIMLIRPLLIRRSTMSARSPRGMCFRSCITLPADGNNKRQEIKTCLKPEQTMPACASGFSARSSATR